MAFPRRHDRRRFAPCQPGRAARARIGDGKNAEHAEPRVAAFIHGVASNRLRSCFPGWHALSLRRACHPTRTETDMSTATSTIEELANREYKHGFITDIEADTLPRGLDEDVIRAISAKK